MVSVVYLLGMSRKSIKEENSPQITQINTDYFIYITLIMNRVI